MGRSVQMPDTPEVIIKRTLAGCRSARLVFDAIVRLALPEPRKKPTIGLPVRRLAQMAGVSTATVKRRLADFVRWNLLEPRETNPGQVNFYRVNWICIPKTPAKRPKRPDKRQPVPPSNSPKTYKPVQDFIRFADSDNPRWRNWFLGIIRKHPDFTADWIKFFGKLLFKIKISLKEAKSILSRLSEVWTAIESTEKGYCWQTFSVAFSAIRAILAASESIEKTEKYIAKIQKSAEKAVGCPAELRRKLAAANLAPY